MRLGTDTFPLIIHQNGTIYKKSGGQKIQTNLTAETENF